MESTLPSDRLPLAGFNVVEIGGGAAAAYCGRLLVDAGARVVAAMDETHRVAGICRSENATEAAYAAYLNAGKERVAVSAQSLETMCKEADIVLIGEEAGVDAFASLPRLATIALAWFGKRGEYRGWQGSDLVVQALTGLTQMAGPIKGPPLGAGDRHATTVAGVTAYIAACAACISGLRHPGRKDPTRLDISILEANLVLAEMHLYFHQRDGIRFKR